MTIETSTDAMQAALTATFPGLCHRPLREFRRDFTQPHGLWTTSPVSDALETWLAQRGWTAIRYDSGNSFLLPRSVAYGAQKETA